MRTVKIRMRAADLSREMSAMREWLDRNRYEAAKFNCDQDGVDVVVSVDFMLDEAAAAFASRFEGKDGPGLTRRSHLGQLAPVGVIRREHQLRK